MAHQNVYYLFLHLVDSQLSNRKPTELFFLASKILSFIYKTKIETNFLKLNHFQLIIEAVPKDETDQARRYRGYIAIDEINFQSGDFCHGHCTFDSGLCTFKNVEGDDDFDWSVVSHF
jgi:hypothetical protein